MTSVTIVVGVAVLYLVACLVIGMLPARESSASAEGYVAGDRSMGTLVMYFITGATIFSAFSFLGMPGWAYSRGAMALYVLGYGALGFVPFYFLGPRAARVGKRYGFVTQAEMVSARFANRPVAAVMAVISILAFLPYLALQMKGAGGVLNAMTRGAVSPEVGAAIVYTVVMVYVVKSGVLGVGWTNTFQGIFMMVLAWAFGLYLPHALYGGVGPMFERIATERPELLKPPGLDASGEPWKWGEYSSALVVSIAGFSFWPHLFMKAFTARSEATLRRTVVLYPTFQIFLVPILFLGFAGVLFSSAPESADQVLPHMLMNIELPAIAVGFFCAGALAASMSSGDAIAHASASIVVRDGAVTAFGWKPDATAERRAIRLLLVVVLVGAYVVSVKYTGALAMLLLYAYGPVTQFAPAVVATLCWRRATGPGVFAGLLVGIAVNILFVAKPEWRPFAIHAGIYALIANAIALVSVSLATRHRDPDGNDEFMGVAGTPSD